MKRLWRRLSEFLSWLPILWRDEQWDCSFLLDILEHKLELMETYFRGERSHVLDNLEITEQIHMARAAIQRLNADRYLQLETLEHNALYGPTDLVEVPYDDCEEGWAEFELKYVDLPEDQQEEAHADFQRCARIAERKRRRDWGLLWMTIFEHGESWWD